MRTLTCICLPDDESSKIIRKISKEISKECNSKRALTFDPHFTVRSEFKISDENIKNLEIDLLEEFSNFSRINLHLKRYDFYPWRIIFIDIDKTNRLQKLHNSCMNVIEKYRTSWILDVYKKAKHLHGKQKEYALKYGYHFAYEFYSPHFTVAGNDMSEDNFQMVKKKFKNEKLDIMVNIKYLAFIDVNDGNRVLLKIPFIQEN